MGQATSRCRHALLAVVVTLFTTATLTAHPHVLPTIHADILFDSDGRVEAIRQIWTYDSAYSTFAARDIDSNKDGEISSAELEAFAKQQTDALVDHDYFTAATVQAGAIAFQRPQSFDVEKLSDGRLRLTFTLPLTIAQSLDTSALAKSETAGPGESKEQGKGMLQRVFAWFRPAPRNAQNGLSVEIYDPNFFAYFTFAENGVRLVGARDGCMSSVTGPQPINLKNTRSIPSLFWQALDGSKEAGRQFVNRITVTCL
jgi:ABC-type uncharacterized transport system substrate-binding protein